MDLRPLVSAIERRGYNVADGRYVSPDSSAQSLLTLGLQKADFCVVVVPHEPSPTCFLEIGIAVGLRKPIALIAHAQASLPFDLAGMSYMRLYDSNPELIGNFLDSFLAQHGLAIQKRTRKEATRSGKGAPHVGASDCRISASLHDSVKQLLRTAAPSEAESLVYNLFVSAGYLASAPAPNLIRAADFAVWFDDFPESVPNPILVEVSNTKAGFLAKRNTEEDLRSALKERGLTLGLLVHNDLDSGGLSAASIWPLVIHISTGQLLTSLKSGSLGAHIVSMRNAAAHGEKSIG